MFVQREKITQKSKQIVYEVFGGFKVSLYPAGYD
jgi:hypothetical protein